MGFDVSIWIIGLLLFAGAAIFLLTLHSAFTGGDDSVKKRLMQLQRRRKKKKTGRQAGVRWTGA